MTDVKNLITANLNIWTGAIKKKAATGRGSNSKIELTGVKKLRELILELAVRGKLVPQDPSDEPASVLLEKIAEEKARLIKEKKIKKPKALPEISEDEKPFDLPEGWEWARLNNLSSYIQRGKSPKYAESGKVSVISQKCIQNSGFTLSPARFVQDDTLSKYQSERFLLEQDLLWNSTGTGTVGRANVLNTIKPNRLVADSHVTVVRLIFVSSQFLWCFIMAPAIQARIQPDHEKTLVSGSTKQVELNTTSVQNLVVPVIPLNEQNRIVKKVNELMILCDQLEQQTERSITAHQTLVEVLLNTLTQSANAVEFQQNWQRIAAHFDTLFTTEHSIDQLKQTILQLAVMGKLVPQDPNDEPASVLLKKIAVEKEQLIKEKKIKKQKSLPPITEIEKPFELPQGWEWVRLDDLSLHSEAGWSPKCEATPRSDGQWGVLKVSAVTWGDFNPAENKQLPSHLEPRPGLEVKKNDFLISRANTAELVARSVVVKDDSGTKLMLSDKIIRFVFSALISPEYISLINNSEWSRNYYSQVAGGTSHSMKNVSRKQIQSLVIALPPVNEHKQIIEKISQITTLCDKLKSNIQQNQAAKVQLAETIVKQAL